MEDKEKDNEKINLILDTIQELYTYFRYIVDINTGTMKICQFNLQIEKVSDENIRLIGKVDGKEGKTSELSLLEFAKMLEIVQAEGVSPNNLTDLEKYILEFFKGVFASLYKDKALTLSNVMKNSETIISGEDMKPIMITGNMMNNPIGFFEFSDFVFDGSVDPKEVRPHVILNFEQLIRLQNIFSLYEDAEEQILKNKKVILTCMNDTIRDRLFKITLNKVNDTSNCYTMDTIKVVKRDPIIKAMANNYGNLQKTFMDSISAKNNDTVDLLSLID